jgi:NitT/TauT family transport system substrate-binding protein
LRALAPLAVLACAGLVVSGCGGGGGGAKKGKPVTLKVGVIPIADVAPLYLGIKKGFFKQQKLTLKPQLASGGAAILPAVVSGNTQIGFSNTISLLIAASKGLPVQIISQGVSGGTNKAKPWADLLVLKSGPIKTGKDLEGKTIAVNTLNNVCQVTIEASLQKQGVNVKKLKFTEVDFPDMLAALQGHRVDGACEVEPFVSLGKADGAKGIDPFYINTAPNYTVATYFTTKSYASKNSDVVKRFVDAMSKSLTYAQSHPAEVRKVLPTYTKIPPAAAQKINLPVWSTDLNRPTIALASKLSKKYGLISKEPNLNDLIKQP